MFLVTFGCLESSKAGEQQVECPKDIPREAVQVVRAPAGWKSFVPFEYTQGVPLTDAGVMYGPPSVMAISKPNGGSGSTVRWIGLRAPADGIWMACFYGDADRRDFIMSRRLDDTTTECSVTHGKRLEIRCR